MLARIGEALDSEFVSLGTAGPQHLRIDGGTKLSGSIDVKTSKNAAVALLCASLLNRGRTTLRSLARIEEVNRILEVLAQHRRADPLAATAATTWRSSRRRELDLDGHRRRRGAAYPHDHHVPRPAAARLRRVRACRTPAAATSASRTIEPHMTALRHFGLEVTATNGFYHASVGPVRSTAPRRSC